MSEKTCKKCLEVKPIGSFYKNKGMLDGHLNMCSSCSVAAVARWRDTKPDCRKVEHAKVREKKGFQTREQYFAKLKTNAIGRKASANNYARANKAKQAAWAKADRAANPEKYKERNKRYTEKALVERPDEIRALKSRLENKRRAAKLERIPPWADEFITAGMYELCSVFRAVGIDMTVDHIVPLQGKTVCGLHTHDNLQLMTRTMNSAKHIKYWPDQP